MVRVISIVALAVLCGCSTYQTPPPVITAPSTPQFRGTPPDPVKVNKARDVYLGCLAFQAGQLDDRTSDAATVGRAVAASCESDLKNLVEVSSSDLAPGERAQVFKRLRVSTVEAAIKIVLKGRAARRQK